MRKLIACMLIVGMIFALCSCALIEKVIVGTWKHQTTVLGVVTETTYTFNEDGTGTKSGVLTIDFTYAFEEDTLLITTSLLGLESVERYAYKFSGDKLVLTGENETIELVRVK